MLKLVQHGCSECGKEKKSTEKKKFPILEGAIVVDGKEVYGYLFKDLMVFLNKRGGAELSRFTFTKDTKVTALHDMTRVTCAQPNLTINLSSDRKDILRGWFNFAQTQVAKAEVSTVLQQLSEAQNQVEDLKKKSLDEVKEIEVVAAPVPASAPISTPAPISTLTPEPPVIPQPEPEPTLVVEVPLETKETPSESVTEPTNDSRETLSACVFEAAPVVQVAAVEDEVKNIAVVHAPQATVSDDAEERVRRFVDVEVSRPETVKAEEEFVSLRFINTSNSSTVSMVISLSDTAEEVCKLISSNFAFESANTQLLHEGTALRAKFSLSSQGVTANSNIFVLPGERPETKKEADEEVVATFTLDEKREDGSESDEEDPHVYPRSILEGFLVKQGGTVKNLKVRYFVLHPNSLAYYSAPGDMVPVGNLKITVHSQVSQQGCVPGSFFFSSDLASKKYFLLAENEDQADKWVGYLDETILSLRSWTAKWMGTQKRMPDSLKEGFLKKRGGKRSSAFKKRYCVLTPKALFYFENDNDTKAKSSIPLTYRAIIKATPNDEQFSFSVAEKMGDREYAFAAANVQDYNEWFSAIHTLIKQKAPIMQGKLEKLGGNVFKKEYQQRFYFLFEDRMDYFKNLTDKEPAGSIPFTATTAIEEGKSEARAFGESFTVQSSAKEKQHQLFAENKAQRAAWLSALRASVSVIIGRESGSKSFDEKDDQ